MYHAFELASFRKEETSRKHSEWIIYLSAAVVAMGGVKGADGQALVRPLAVENTVAPRADRSQRFRWKSL